MNVVYMNHTTAQADPLRREAKLAIAKKVRQLRHAHQLAAAATATSSGSGDGDSASGEEDRIGGGAAGSAAALEASMPEYVLPYAIHLLAHHPDFPVDKASDKICSFATRDGGGGCIGDGVCAVVILLMSYLVNAEMEHGDVGGWVGFRYLELDARELKHRCGWI